MDWTLSLTMTIYQFQSLQRMDWHFQNKCNVKMGHHLKPCGTFHKINTSQRRGLQKQKNSISRN
jgi:hypothetical protein